VEKLNNQEGMVIDQEIRKVMKRRTKINIERKEDKDRKDLMRV